MVYHPALLATKQYQEHIHGIICTLEKTRYQKKNKKEKHAEREEARRKGKSKKEEKRRKNIATMYSGRRPSPEDKFVVSWYDQSYDMPS